MAKKRTKKKSKKTSRKKSPKDTSQFVKTLLFISVVFVLILLAIYNVFAYYAQSKVVYVAGTRSTVHEEISYWKDFVSENPTYAGAWVQIAKLEMQRGNMDDAKEALVEAEELKPNSVEVKKLKRQLP